jgi:hypothetical protein
MIPNVVKYVKPKKKKNGAPNDSWPTFRMSFLEGFLGLC